jgi:hypothetical protein
MWIEESSTVLGPDTAAIGEHGHAMLVSLLFQIAMEFQYRILS